MLSCSVFIHHTLSTYAVVFLSLRTTRTANWPKVCCHASVTTRRLDKALINNIVGCFTTTASLSLAHSLWQQGQQLYYESRCAYALSSPREQQEGHWFSCNNIILCTAGSKLMSYLQYCDQRWLLSRHEAQLKEMKDGEMWSTYRVYQTSTMISLCIRRCSYCYWT